MIMIMKIILNGSIALFLGLERFLSSVILYTVGMTP
jgi:hypothetical protein